MFLSIAAGPAAPEDSGGTHPSFQHTSQVWESHKKMSSIHVLVTVFVPTVNPEDTRLQCRLLLLSQLIWACSQSHKLLHSSRNLAEFPGKKMELLQIKEIPVSPRATAPNSAAEFQMATWFFYPSYGSGVRFFLSGFLGREHKDVVTKCKIYLCAWKQKVKIHPKFQSIESYLHIYFSCYYKYWQISSKLFFSVSRYSQNTIKC